MPYDFHPEDWPVIEASIKLGDWIISRREATPDDRGIVRRVQGALRHLPEVDHDIDADFGYDIEREENGVVVRRSWRGGIGPEGLLEIFSSYYDPRLDVHGQASHEHWWEFHPSGGAIRAGRHDKWTSEVQRAERFVAEADRFGIETWSKERPSGKDA